MSQSKNIRTYAAVLWEAPYHYDKSKFFILNSIINFIKILIIKKILFKQYFTAQWYSTWLSTSDAADAPFDGNGFLGDGEAMVRPGSTHQPDQTKLYRTVNRLWIPF